MVWFNLDPMGQSDLVLVQFGLPMESCKACAPIIELFPTLQTPFPVLSKDHHVKGTRRVVQGLQKLLEKPANMAS